MKSVKEFMDYRDYLKAFYDERKRNNHNFSFRYMEQKLSINASYLVKLFKKKCHLANTSVETVVSFCKLGESEADYFSVLVKYNKSKTVRDSKLYGESMIAMRKNDRPVTNPVLEGLFVCSGSTVTALPYRIAL